jgi:hypothetical protein
MLRSRYITYPCSSGGRAGGIFSHNVSRVALSASVLLFLFLPAITPTASASPLFTERDRYDAHSAEYVRTQSRNASVDPDAVFYNPAGLVFLKDGLYLNLSAQGVYDRKECTPVLWGIQGSNLLGQALPWQAPTSAGWPLIGTTNDAYLLPRTYQDTAFVPFVPDLGLIYKQDKWAVYLHVAIDQTYPDMTRTRGIPELDRALVTYTEALCAAVSAPPIGIATGVQNVLRQVSSESTDLNATGTVGGSYAPLSWLSGSVGFRFMYSRGSRRITQSQSVETSGSSFPEVMQSPMDIDVALFGYGFGIVAGFDVRPVYLLNIGLRGEYYPPMWLTKKTNRFVANPAIAQSGILNIYCDSILPLANNDQLNTAGGQKGVLNFAWMDPRTLKDIGNRVKVTRPPSVSAGMSVNVLDNVRLETSADISFPRSRDLDGRERGFRPVAYRLGQAVEWGIVPMVTASAGYSYNDTGMRPTGRSGGDEFLNSHTVGAGLTVRAAQWLDITAAGYYRFFVPASNRSIDVIPFSYKLVGVSVLGTLGSAWGARYSERQWGLALGVSMRIFGENGLIESRASGRIKSIVEEHYVRGMTAFLSNDIDTALKEFRIVREYDPHYKNIGQKIKDLEEIKGLTEKNKQEERKKKNK